MADRAGERTTTRDTDELLADIDGIGTESEEGRGRASRTTDADPTLSERAGAVFSLRTFLVALVLAAVGSGVGGFVPLVGGVLAFVGLFLAAFVLGTASARQHYLEAGVASAVVAGGSALGNYFVLTFVGAGLPFVAVSAGIGLVCGLAGHYFGRDLRDGLTREI